MPNFYTTRINNFIDNCGSILSYLNGTYMDRYANRLIDIGTDCLNIDAMQFVRLLQYRKTDSDRMDFEHIRDAMSANLRMCAAYESAFGYFIVSKDGEYSVYLGIEGQNAGGIKSNINASVPDAAFANGFISGKELSGIAQFGGIVTGDVDCREGMLDQILEYMRGVNGVAALLAIPMRQREVDGYAGELANLKQLSASLLRGTDQTNQGYNPRTYAYVPELDSFLEKRIAYFSKPGETYWKSCIWFGCEDMHRVQSLGSAIAGALNRANNNELDQARAFVVAENPLRYGRMVLPLADYSDLTYPLPEAAGKPSLLAYVSSTNLATVLQLPTYQFNGFNVIQLTRTAASHDLFDGYASPTYDRSVRLGTLAANSTPFTLNLNDFTSHVLVTGATGSGKTNTVMNLIKGVHTAGIPTLIVEPSKKEYWKLAADMRDLKIYSFGRDAEPLRINPLIPETGTVIANHIDAVMSAFAGAFDMEEPTRLALDGLLKYAYEQCGWSLDDFACMPRSGMGNKRYPKIQDLLFWLPEYVNRNLPYGDEVRQNILGSLMNRLNMLNSGVIGAAVNSEQPVSGKDLCSGSVLVELDDLSLDVKPFVAMLIMIKADQYLRKGNSSSELKNLIVLEEAHNIFANVSGNRVGRAADQASRFFSNMLSQIRAYGTGIIIADQGASQINDMAVSNTKVKIIHRIVDGNDIEKVSFALNLTNIQKRVFPALATGEAIVSVGGKLGAVQVNVNYADCTPIRNTACIFCTRKAHCRDYNTLKWDNIPRSALYARQIYENRYDPSALAGTVNSVALSAGCSQDEKFCLLGALLENKSVGCGEREKRRIVNLYRDFK